MFAPDDEDPRGDLIVIGGGCYGSYHARQLQKARLRGAIEARNIVVVDRDPACRAAEEFRGLPGFRFVVSTWDDFHDDYFDRRSPVTRDRIAPTPVAPHLLCSWLMRRAARAGTHRVRILRPPGLPDTPFTLMSETGAGFLSFATWICPVTCIEPAICPKTRGPKDWEMDDAVYAFARKAAASGEPFHGVEVFRCRHYAWGVGTYPAAAAVRAAARLDRRLAGPGRDRETRLLVGTVSSCHGVVNLVGIGPAES